MLLSLQDYFKLDPKAATANNIDNPDACLTFTGTELSVTYPGA